MSVRTVLVPLLLSLALFTAAGAEIAPDAVRDTTRALIDAHGETHAGRIDSGVRQVAERWRDDDGDTDAFRAFCREQFIADHDALRRTFERLQTVLEQVDGHLHEVRRELTRPAQLDTGPVQAVDRLLGGIDLGDHVDENLFRSKVGFLALLNFPVDTLADRLERSAEWSRERWARSRMMDRFARRVPSAVAQGITAAMTHADDYIAEYNIHTSRLVDTDGARPFPDGPALITHWGLRDELKSQYAEPDGLARQRMILRVMERIVRQEIPAQAIDSDEVFWSPETNELWAVDAATSGPGSKLTAEREADVRYRRLLDVFQAVRAADRYSPTAPSYIARRFDLDREIPEKQVEALLVSVLESKEFRDAAKLVRQRLGRPLEAFDIWYDGFTSRGAYGEDRLDEITKRRYPEVAAFQRDLPRLLTDLGFAPARAAWLSEHIAVDPSRGAGHASGAVRREDKAHLRTRFQPDGMDYKGYNIAVHELGHNVEQVFSLNAIDHWWMQGVPNTAFTEALAFVFQERDLELLGLDAPGEDARHMAALDTLWGAAEIGGVALVDMAVWRWMYEHPDTTPAELRVATLRIAREVWNRYFAPAFGVRDQEVLAIYSHMIAFGLYLPDYPLGHIIAFQLAEKMRGDGFGAEFERVTRQGRLTPDRWMRGAVGKPIATKALLGAAREALEQ